jgi:HAD superfamily phosphoserine phosphatase-like hydrolase
MDFVTSALVSLVDTPANRQNLKILDKCRGQLVPFVGAGLSADFGYPAWHKMLEDFANSAGVTAQVAPLLSAFRFEEAAEIVMNELPNQFEDSLRETFDIAKLPRPLANAAVCHLPNIARGLVITTNFDGVLEAAFEDAGRRFSQVFPGTRIREATRAVQLNEHCLLKLHGDYRESESRILTLSAYKAQYGDEPDKLQESLPLPTVLGQALASRPLFFLGCSLKNDRTTKVINSLAKRYPGVIHFALLSNGESSPARRKQLDLWNIRPLFFPAGEFQKIGEFLSVLAAQHATASLGQPPIGPDKTSAPAAATPTTRINGYKLFYFRKTRKQGTKALAMLSGVPEKTIVKIERVRKRDRILGVHWFQPSTREVLSKLERALECPGALEAGQPDDFLTLYTLFYKTYRGTRHGIDRAEVESTLDFETKAVVFDFDGTLTIRTDEETTWEKIWLKLGYTIQDCAELHAQYSNGKITHQEWCDLTLKKFQQRKFHRTQLNEIGKSIRLVDGAIETLDAMRQQGIRLYVASGSVKQVISQALGAHWDWFDELHANDIVFDASGYISEIRGTKFDFEGKAAFIKRIVAENAYAPTDVLFVGNSLNDVFAIQSGARTLCVNARATDQYNKQHWTYFISRMDNLNQILKYVSL